MTRREWILEFCRVSKGIVITKLSLPYFSHRPPRNSMTFNFLPAQTSLSSPDMYVFRTSYLKGASLTGYCRYHIMNILTLNRVLTPFHTIRIRLNWSLTLLWHICGKELFPNNWFWIPRLNILCNTFFAFIKVVFFNNGSNILYSSQNFRGRGNHKF